MKFANYQGLTDHKPIEITVHTGDMEWEKVDTKIYTKNKRFLESQSMILLERLYLANDLKEVNQAFA